MLDTPEETIATFVRCVHSRDVAGLVRLYEPDALFIPAPGQRVQGHAALTQAFQSIIALRPALEVHPAEVVSNADLAWIANVWSLRATAPDGTAVERAGRSSVVLRRQPDGTWRIALDRL
jgi:uncharacterized protein (TIGR02246 family)